ncbi:MAG: HDOD domain-containing protein [Verrucomicrobia bacterium]|nr:HDOD domain-containing protein [Verrucomicrobiota bacterium]
MNRKEEFSDAVNQVVNQVIELHPNLAVLSSLSNLLNKPDTALDDLAQLIKSEPALTADIIKISNSSFYAASSECSDIESSLARIGFNDVLKVVSLILSQNLCSMRLESYRMDPDDLWAESVTASLLMETMALAARLNKAKAATTGILHNVGRVIINNLMEYFQIDLRWDASIPVTDWEESVVGFNYGEAGGRFLREMKFPEEIREIIRYHVDPGQAPQAPHPLTHLLHYCVQLADLVGRGFSNTAYNVPDTTQLRQHVELSGEDIREAVAEAKSRYEQINRKVLTR